MGLRIVAAEWVVPVCRPPMRRACVVIADGTVVWTGRVADIPADYRTVPVERYDGVLTPGLVNAHTHLQYSGFAPLGRGSYTGFEHWSEAFGAAYSEVEGPDEWRQAALAGARRLAASGTTQVAEVITDDAARGALRQVGLRGIEYLEAVGYVEHRWVVAARAGFVARLDAADDFPIGISPHAPYSLDPAVVRDLVELAEARRLRVHSHLAESSAEADLYFSGRPTVLEPYGDLRDEFELVRSGGSAQSTALYADSLGLLNDRSHLAHGIYLDRADRDLVRERQAQVALCPRSNRVIGLDEAPVAAYLREGHDLAVGTDSLASSPSLDLMEDVAELARIARRQGYAADDLYPRLLHAATRGGARAIGRPDDGVLAPGAIADLAVFDVSVPAGRVEEALVRSGAGHCVLTVVAGETRFRAGRSVVPA